MNEQEENNLEAVVDAVQAALDRNHYRKAGELIRAYAASLAQAQRERDAQAASADRCPECRAGDQPVYDEHWKAWYHDRLLCLGTAARLAIRAQS